MTKRVKGTASRASSKSGPSSKPKSASSFIKADVAFKVSTAANQLVSGGDLGRVWIDAIDIEILKRLDPKFDRSLLKKRVDEIMSRRTGGEAGKDSEEELKLACPESWLMRFIVRQIYLLAPAKEYSKVIKVITSYGNVNEFDQDFIIAYSECFKDAVQPTDQYSTCLSMLKSRMLTDHIRGLHQSRITKKAKLPTAVVQLTDDFNKLSKAVSDYINSEEALIEALSKRLDEARSRKINRQREVEDVKAMIKEFNSTKSGKLTDVEIEECSSEYAATPALRVNASFAEFVSMVSKRKSVTMIESMPRRIWQFDASAKATGYIERAASNVTKSSTFLSRLTSATDSAISRATNPRDSSKAGPSSSNFNVADSAQFLLGTQGDPGDMSGSESGGSGL